MKDIFSVKYDTNADNYIINVDGTPLQVLQVTSAILVDMSREVGISKDELFGVLLTMFESDFESEVV